MVFVEFPWYGIVGFKQMVSYIAKERRKIESFELLCSVYITYFIQMKQQVVLSEHWSRVALFRIPAKKYLPLFCFKRLFRKYKKEVTKISIFRSYQFLFFEGAIFTKVTQNYLHICENVLKFYIVLFTTKKSTSDTNNIILSKENH